MAKWVSYKNGNYIVYLDLDTGTKVKKNDSDHFEPSTIDSMDFKITNFCDMGCAFCHEDSSIYGKHADVMNLKFVDSLHPYTEIAIGGGNPLSHPDLIPFLEKCKKLKLVPSLTINQAHFQRQKELVDKLVREHLIYGLGISLTDASPEFIEEVKKYPNVIIHVINGVITDEQFFNLANNGLKILILGYKEVRRGRALYTTSHDRIEERKNSMNFNVRVALKSNWFDCISFDNLALKQLDIKSIIPESLWNEFYMGDDGIDGSFDSASMFIDGVEKKFARNSCDMTRYDLLDNIKDMFKILRENGGK